jgi:predicted nucleic acid-binding protein
MVASPQKRLSLDTNVLFDLAEGRDFAHDFRETCRSKGYALLISPTVVAELYFLNSHGADDEQRLAAASLARMGTWDVHVFPLTGVQIQLARWLALAILEAGILPPTETNDANILAEAAVGAIPLVVSSDHHLLDVDEDALRDECLKADLSPVYPISPRRFVRAIS